MKKYFIYSLQKVIWPFSIMFVVALITIILPELATENYYFVYTAYDESISYSINFPPIDRIIVFLGALTFVVPVLQFEFSKNRRLVDQYYSAPISRRKLLATNYLVGLLELFALTIIFSLLLIAVVISKPNVYDIGHFFLIIPFLLFSVFVTYSLNCFIFHQANTLYDGVIFMLFYVFILLIAYQTVFSLMPMEYFDGPPYGMSITPFVYTQMAFMDFIMPPVDAITGEPISNLHRVLEYEWGDIVDAISLFVLAVAAVFGLILYAPKEKVERAGQISNSWFGYKVINPALIFMTTGLLNMDPFIQILIPITYLIIITIIYRRTFKVHWRDWIIPLSSYALGIGFNFLRNFIETLYIS
ncbi:MAG: hypothetical protein WCR35_01680 [Bacilli bacterium]